MNIRIAGTVPESIVDGPGMRFTLFVQGCPHNCEGCHNPQTHDFNSGKLTTTDEIIKSIEENPYVRKVTFSGGEPFSQPEAVSVIAEKLKEDNFHIMCYSGYTIEKLIEMGSSDIYVKKLLNNIDVLIDGPFVLSKRSLELKFKGSSNQRTIDVKASLKQGKAVTIEL